MISNMSARQLISPSILSADFTRLGDTLRELEAAGADWIHIDVMDGHFVPNLTMGPFIVEACRRATKLPLDVHLMIEAPDHLVKPFVEAGADWLTVHIETCPHVHRSLQAIRGLGIKAGVSLNPGTPASALSEVIGEADLVLVMTVNPGYSGQSFLEGVVPKIRQVREMRDQAGSPALIQVDGGISPKTAGKVIEAGAEVLVAAHAIFHHPGGIPAGLAALRAVWEPTPA
jgi:ribulose-phosphate 3-epimerase